jgi:hypothetical protein
MEPGAAWRRHCWRRARESLVPVLPVEVVRLRVARARELGLDYRTYAGVRAMSGRDVIAVLFSTNALRILPALPALPPDRAARLAAIRGCGRIALAQPPLTVAAVAAAADGVLDAAHPAPRALAPFPEMRDRLRAALGALPSGAVLLVGDQALEREWCAAGRLGGYLAAERFFAAAPPDGAAAPG